MADKNPKTNPKATKLAHQQTPHSYEGLPLGSPVVRKAVDLDDDTEEPSSDRTPKNSH